MLTEFPYIKFSAVSGNIVSDVKDVLLSNDKLKTFGHVKNVAEMNMKIADQYGLDKSVCELCGYLHDISAMITPDDMLAYAEVKAWYLDESERRYPFLLHQRISKAIAKQDFCVTDERVLSAIECHSTLKMNPSTYDMALFIADKLAWDQEGEAPFYSVVNDALKQSLELASLAYMEYVVENKMILFPHKWFKEGVRFLREMKS